MTKINFDEIDFVIIDGKEEIDLKERLEGELELNESKVNKHLKEQPSLFAFYVVLSEVATDELRSVTLVRDVTKSGLQKHYRNKALKEKRKITVQEIEEQVQMDEKFIEAEKNVNEWKKNVGILNGIKESFRHRKEALIALASNMRAQMDVEIFVEKDKIKRSKK
jgi:hypothetical protein